jgi:hypothetical protein
MKNEGMKQDQAVAYAINYCKKKHNHSAEDSSRKVQQMMGGSYKFRENGDGSFTILDVPIMSEVPAGEKGNEDKVSKLWMEKAVAKARKREQLDGYMAPLHIDHHDTGKKTSAAGFILPTKVAKMKYEGKNLWTVFANLEVPAPIMEKIRKKELPYRSVEIFGWDKPPEINSLALLSDEVPFFRYPVLTLGEELPNGVHQFQSRPLKAYQEAKDGVSILYNFNSMKKRIHMAEIEKKEEEEKVEMKEEELESRAERADVDSYEYEEGKKEGEKEEKEKMGAKFEERSDEFFDHMFDLLRKIAVAVGAEVDEDDAEVEVDETVGVEIEEEEAMAPAEDMKMGARGNLVAKLSGQIAALESRAKKQDRDAKITSLVDNGMKALSAWSPDEDIRVKMSELANNAKSPAKSVRTFVTTYKQTVPKTPPATFEEYSANAAVADHPEVMRFQAEGPEQFEKAREASSMFDDLAERGVIKSTRAQFIATTLRDNN